MLKRGDIVIECDPWWARRIYKLPPSEHLCRNRACVYTVKHSTEYGVMFEEVSGAYPESLFRLAEPHEIVESFASD